MKYIILLLILLSSIAYAEDFTLNMDEDFEFDDLNFEFHYSKSSPKSLIQNDYMKLILPLDECDTKGYFKFCLTNATLDMDELTEYKLTATLLGCIPLTAGDNSTCKAKIKEECENDNDCASKKCLHEVCTFRWPICGDTFCDDNEKCDEDCKVEINETVEEVVEEVIEEPEPEVIAEPVVEETAVAEPELIAEPEPESIPDFHTTEEEPANTNKVIIWISIITIVLVIAYVIGITIYKKRKNTFEL